MKAIAVRPAGRRVEIVEHAEPRLQSATQVRLRMLEAGVCGTDREICAFQYGTPPPGSETLVIGHESLGRVVEVGPEVEGIKVGDLAVPMVRRGCLHAHCRACREGRPDFCFTGDFTERGIKEAHGFMTEVVVDDQAVMNVVPESLRDVAVLVEPLTIAEKALAQLWHVQRRLPWGCPPGHGDQPGHCRTAVVLGAGPVGLLGAMALRHAGFATYVYSRTPAPNDKSELVSAIGATYVSSDRTPPARLAEMAGSIDVVYEAVGASRVAFEVMQVLGANGVFLFTGVPGRKGPVPLDTDLLMRNLVLKNQVVLGTVNAGRETYRTAIRDLQAFASKWPAAVRSLITGRHGIEDHQDLLVGRARGIKNVITLSQGA
ncbi:MAG TPA: glucose 1-dehydrogenase [Candidatus Polarisedimenticolia bacterium]|nr:glucose 1-dehydrogenase [Candidatus Polarisedimenticolia bacterium]